MAVKTCFWNLVFLRVFFLNASSLNEIFDAKNIGNNSLTIFCVFPYKSQVIPKTIKRKKPIIFYSFIYFYYTSCASTYFTIANSFIKMLILD